MRAGGLSEVGRWGVGSYARLVYDTYAHINNDIYIYINIYIYIYIYMVEGWGLRKIAGAAAHIQLLPHCVPSRMLEFLSSLLLSSLELSETTIYEP